MLSTTHNFDSTKHLAATPVDARVSSRVVLGGAYRPFAYRAGVGLAVAQNARGGQTADAASGGRQS